MIDWNRFNKVVEWREPVVKGLKDGRIGLKWSDMAIEEGIEMVLKGRRLNVGEIRRELAGLGIKVSWARLVVVLEVGMEVERWRWSSGKGREKVWDVW